jgi:hypothetical protein
MPWAESAAKIFRLFVDGGEGGIAGCLAEIHAGGEDSRAPLCVR